MPLQSIVLACDDSGAMTMDAAALVNLDAANAAAVTEIHLFCRGLYTLPFDPVPDEIRSLAAQLTKVHLYYRRTAEDVPESIAALHKRLQDQLRGITANTFRIDVSAADDSVAASQGPRVTETPQRFGQGFLGELLDPE